MYLGDASVVSPKFIQLFKTCSSNNLISAQIKSTTCALDTPYNSCP